MRLSHRYMLFNTVKVLTILSQIAITIFFVYWCWHYIGGVLPQMIDETSKFIVQLSGGKSDIPIDFTGVCNIYGPIFTQFLIFISILVLLGMVRSFAKSMSMSHKHILFWIQTKEIHPLFAYRLSHHFMWNRNIGHQDFFTFWKDFKYQNKILELHQHEKDFYDYLTTYNEAIREYKPYPTSSKSIIRREDVLGEKVDPDIGHDESEKDKDMI